MNIITKISLTSLLFVVSIINAQQYKKNIILDWENETQVVSKWSGERIKIPMFKDGFYDENYMPYYFYQWKVAPNLEVSTFKIDNIVYETIDRNAFNTKSLAHFSDTLQDSFIVKKARDKSYAQLKITPIVKVNGSLKKIISFQINYSFTNAKQSKNSSNIHDSPLATGDWYKFAIDTTGVYKLDKAFLSSLGIKVNSINPKNIQIYGNGGARIPEKNSEFRYDDLQENAIYVKGEEDESFDSGDYVLFYGQGLDVWIPNISAKQARHQKNIYANRAYYFIHVSSYQGKRIANNTDTDQIPSMDITTFNDFAIHELEKINLDYFGQQFFGENFSINDTQNFKIKFKDIDLTKEVAVRLSVATVSGENVRSKFLLNYNNESIVSLTIGGVVDTTIGNIRQRSGMITPIDEELDFEIKFDNLGKPSSRGYLDYIEINGIKKLIARDKQFSFRSYDLARLSQASYGEFIIENKDNIHQIWNVSNKIKPEIISNNSSDNTFRFTSQGGVLNEYVVLNKNNFYIPIRLAQSKIKNQNLHALLDIDYLIITDKKIIDEAERLANFHKGNGLTTLVLTEQQIYNEFSSGGKDPVAIRDFIKYLYVNATSDEKRIKYVLMFGDTSFDFKNIQKQNKGINVISYQSKNSESLARSYVTDDFFVMLDDNEGDFYDNDGHGDLIDVAIGRMPVKNYTEAVVVVDKTLNYYSKEAFGNWRNLITFLADDADKIGEDIFIKKEEYIADKIKQYKPVYNINKIYADSYVQQNSSGGETYPQVKKAVDNAIERGTLLINYFGHGGENGLGHEGYVDNTQLRNWNNYNTSPLFITITCEISRFDNPTRVSGGEGLFVNKNGGSINMISTAREVYITSGATFNERLLENVINYSNDDSQAISESLLATKNINPSDNQRFFIQLFGDPAMKLAKPQPKIKLTHMNDVDVSQELDTIKALSHVFFKGIVTDKNDDLLTGFNGSLSVTVYDKETIRQTLNNDGKSDIIPFDVRDSKIFNGNATVINGEWKFDFIAPRDIRIAYGSAKLSFYADNKIIDKNGYNTDIIIGGINYDAPEDNLGPKIKLFMNDESFIDGGNTNESPLFLAVLEDDSGINTSLTAVDHDIIAILDGDQSNPIVMNDYFETEANNFKKGSVKYPFRDLSVGLHTLTFKCWDTYNNPSESSISFVVVSDSKLVLDNVLNYPNPFINYTEFWFNHNKPNEALEAQVQIFTVSGKLIKTINQQVLTTGTLSRTMIWNGLDDFGNKIGKGVYIYKLKVKVVSNGLKSEKVEKLVILQ